MSITINSIQLTGLNCSIVEVETHLSRGLPAFNIVGLGDTAVHESKERVRSALINSGFTFPTNHKTVNLAPANLKKQGPIFDLPIAIGLLIESGQLNLQDIAKSLFIGELALHGDVKSVKGILVMCNFAREKRFKRIYVPAGNLSEAQAIKDIEIIGLKNLKELKRPHNLEPSINKKSTSLYFPCLSGRQAQKAIPSNYDFSLVKGQKHAKRALEIAAAGGHHLLMHGSPGCGKTLLARSFSSILPELKFQEKIELSQIYSIKGLLSSKQPLIHQRPFREVHHTASAVAIIGGGARPEPGEISLAHKGVLFLDEIAEFPRAVLEVLRQPIENKFININRAQATCKFPASFQLIAAMNPCHCGWYKHPKRECKCTKHEIEKYNKRLSGPLRDRIDIIIKMQTIDSEQMIKNSEEEPSNSIRKRVEQARKLQEERYSTESHTTNSELSIRGLKKYINLSQEAQNTLSLATKKLNISMRAYNRILKLSRTIADLEKSKIIKSKHLNEAISYRQEL